MINRPTLHSTDKIDRFAVKAKADEEVYGGRGVTRYETEVELGLMDDEDDRVGFPPIWYSEVDYFTLPQQEADLPVAVVPFEEQDWDLDDPGLAPFRFPVSQREHEHGDPPFLVGGIDYLVHAIMDGACDTGLKPIKAKRGEERRTYDFSFPAPPEEAAPTPRYSITVQDTFMREPDLDNLAESMSKISALMEGE